MIVVFDAHCLLCSGSVQFLLRHDHRRRLRFATTQSEAGRALLDKAGIDAIDPESFVLVDDARAWTESAAVLRVAHALGWPWRLAWVAWIVPAPLRDALYRWIARHRYRWFGRSEHCFLPDAADATRFIR
ncbi:thiol-disulfide oxidoreductase DCC family protein [Dokdonella immobilis]|uniref:Predicted thiol-disulfide oxidoreductase YuxK, DCC family n=1 Tax=Dokdonella immobilis TaxID=578942 RepID=A0A1I4Z7C2_9GAMM|nr:thiol-disulfide oxidoreductase DCC family protein [Dokdonella immobilis]SFN46191.1 Predicted thiol-disulfide oxidoreductase YuxK, DCC family [Dokdonella immobilis]